MSEEKENTKTPKVNPKKNDAPDQPVKITVQDVLNSYPPDREKVRDQILLSISNELIKISATLDWFARRKQEEIDKTIQLKG